MRLRRHAIITVIGIAGLLSSCERKGLTSTASAGESRRAAAEALAAAAPVTSADEASRFSRRRPERSASSARLRTLGRPFRDYWKDRMNRTENHNAGR